MTSDVVSPRKSEKPAGRDLSPEQAAAAAMVAQARERGLELTGPNGHGSQQAEKPVLAFGVLLGVRDEHLVAEDRHVEGAVPGWDAVGRERSLG
jgi:hypothetical protein